MWDVSYLSRKIAQYISDDYATNFQEMFTWIYKEVSEIVQEHCELCTMHKCFIFFHPNDAALCWTSVWIFLTPNAQQANGETP